MDIPTPDSWPMADHETGIALTKMFRGYELTHREAALLREYVWSRSSSRLHRLRGRMQRSIRRLRERLAL